jgi:hypothetical protein
LAVPRASGGERIGVVLGVGEAGWFVAGVVAVEVDELVGGTMLKARAVELDVGVAVWVGVLVNVGEAVNVAVFITPALVLVFVGVLVSVAVALGVDVGV